NTSGRTALTQLGIGTTTLNAANTYGGATTISAGLVKLPSVSISASTVATPLLYMSFDNVSGSTVVNDGSGGTAMNGILNGTASIVSGGRFGGNCLSLSATVNAGSVRITNSVVALNVSGTWTVGLWLKTSSQGGT